MERERDSVIVERLNVIATATKGINQMKVAKLRFVVSLLFTEYLEKKKK
jgi:hypothetical protein